MIQHTLKSAITQALQEFHQVSTSDGIKHLFETLGYSTQREVLLDNQTPDEVLKVFAWENFREDKGLLKEWESVNCLFQVTEDEITQNGQGKLFQPSFDTDYLKSYIFLGLTLQKSAYSRSDLAKITREINRQSDIPIMVLFCYGNYVTLSIINRRPNKLDRDKDVLEKITLIKDININSPHRAHIEILADLALPSLPDVQNFDKLHTAWQKVLNTSELNNKFFQEVSNWYFWATQTVTFPDGGEADESIRNATSVIRLITRLIFVWFLKEKGLVPDALFDENQLTNLLKSLSPKESSYYQAILQNLFFATLNTEMNTDEKPDNRKFRGKNQQKGGRDGHYGIANVYRYQDYFTNADEFLRLCSNIPFLNGGLFECLDRDKDSDSAPTPKGKEKTKIRIDGFSDREDNVLNVPNVLFFGEATDVDLNQTYGTKNKKYKVQGLINIFNRYKFTIDENTPIEEEIALDPELLGKVFENLLAEYNPETETTARKQTGSFYTPREIVNYMVDESLIAYLQNSLPVAQANNQDDCVTRLTHLLSYTDDSHQFNDDEVDCLINAIDNLKIIDIACGSGAFPMGILQKLVFILGKLDPNNSKWKQQQKEKTIAPILKDIQVVKQISYEQAREEAIQKLQERLAEIEDEFENNEMDYPRKLFLIENCIFGVDIQPIAVQISKLRFFISLIVDQRVNNNQANRGILPLPNLETKFVAANSLIGLGTQLSLRSPEVIKKEGELKQVRQQHFQARTPKTKKKCREKDHILRTEISQLLKSTGLDTATADTLARWNPYDLNTCADFFDPSWMFGVDAFDICIGNPPYVRQEKIKELKPILKQQYSCFTGVADLYVYFFEQAIKLLKERGILTYITSNKYFRSGYGEKLREFLVKKTQLKQLIDFGDAPVFTAIAYPSIIITVTHASSVSQTQNIDKVTHASSVSQTQKMDKVTHASSVSQTQKMDKVTHASSVSPKQNIDTKIKVLNWQIGKPIDNFIEVLNTDSFYIEQKALKPQGWQLEDNTVLHLLEKLRKTGTPLGEYVNGRFYRGVLTGFNEAFIVDRATRDRLINEHPSSEEVLKPFLRGKDVKRWVVNFAEQYLIKIESSENKKHPWSDKPEKEAEKIFSQTYPAIYQYLNQYREQLIKRYDQGKYFWELRSCKYWNEFEETKIVYPDIAKYSEFSWDANNYYLVNTLYLMPTSNKYILGILNSQTTYWYYTQISPSIRGDFYRFIAQYVSQIPIPKPTDTQDACVTRIVDKILEIKRQNPKADTTKLEREIDEIVYKLYGLTAEEIQIIEESGKR
ncbi:Eco57I restriction-modification methylase domain-containing protein [Anabaena sp. FACHB-1237]|uniref:Eco57I restriction-modification methylase domain-containing protein n=1 Tax=Anabaena sp. FACHB-1237 TaxID=2692769 RepID=UPI00168101B5|nr:TaqI-like C-terminal specificity domain-containing protein [Anabaena sp. FACHB-1237]MBD2138056.1 Eco57I restriction-modification methylase domain-containing protein [Anabaena sp. FACHB-1237]